MSTDSSPVAAPRKENPKEQALWEAVMGVVQAAAKGGVPIDCPAVSHLSDVACEYAKERRLAVTADPARPWARAAQQIERRVSQGCRTAELFESVIAEYAPPVPTLERIALEQISEIVTGDKEFWAKKGSELVDVLKNMKLKLGVLQSAVDELKKLKPWNEVEYAMFRAFGRALAAISEIATGSPTAWSERDDQHGDGLEWLVEAVRKMRPERRKPSFVLPPPGTAFRATVDTEGKSKRETLEFYHFANGRISGNLGEQWKPETFEKRNAVLESDQ